MLFLKGAIERFHENQEQQGKTLDEHEARQNEQGSVNLRTLKGQAEMKGELTQHRVHMETAHNTLMDGLRNAPLAELI